MHTLSCILCKAGGLVGPGDGITGKIGEGNRLQAAADGFFGLTSDTAFAC